MAATVTLTECIDATPKRRIYDVNVFGTTITTTVTSTPSVMRRWLYAAIYQIRRRFCRTVVGMGVQWCSRSSNDYAATLQFCVGTSCLIIKLFHASTVPRILGRFLLDPSITFVGFWNHSDAWRLARCKHELAMARPPLDLRLHSETDEGQSLRGASFETIVEECLGYRGVGLERHISRSNWEVSKLSKKQVSQATVDAYAAFLTGKQIGAWRF